MRRYILAVLALLFSKDPVIGEALAGLIRSIAAITVLNAGDRLDLIEGQLTCGGTAILIFTDEFLTQGYEQRIADLRLSKGIRTILIAGGRIPPKSEECFDYIIDRREGTQKFVLSFRRAISQVSPNNPEQSLTRTVHMRASGGVSPRLTAREEQVASLVIEGHSNQEIANELAVSLPTAKLYVGRLLKAFDCRNRVQLANQLRDLRGTVSQR
ncbi:MAG: helix-turn-helix transcriptional regulator [Fimbriimonadales bacterium]